jgi:hypothetical protein
MNDHLNRYLPPRNYQAQVHNGQKISAQSQRHHGSYRLDIEDDNKYAYHDGDLIRVHIFDACETILSADIQTLQISECDQT